jgi:hypothetical protein
MSTSQLATYNSCTSRSGYTYSTPLQQPVQSVSLINNTYSGLPNSISGEFQDEVCCMSPYLSPFQITIFHQSPKAQLHHHFHAHLAPREGSIHHRTRSPISFIPTGIRRVSSSPRLPPSIQTNIPFPVSLQSIVKEESGISSCVSTAQSIQNVTSSTHNSYQKYVPQP